MSGNVVRKGEPDRPRRSLSERERLVEAIAGRMDKPLTVLGVIFVLLVAADTAAGREAPIRPWLNTAVWVVWGAFALEFALRAVIAPSAWRFLRRNWWQAVFLLVPFLRFMRVAGRLARLRPSRLLRLLSSTVRGVRTASRTLTSRLAWLTAVTLVVVLAASQVLYEFGGYASYIEALHDAAYGAITGQPLKVDSGVADIMELVLALYAVVVFAVLAGSLGAYFLEGRVSTPTGQEQQ